MEDKKPADSIDSQEPTPEIVVGQESGGAMGEKGINQDKRVIANAKQEDLEQKQGLAEGFDSSGKDSGENDLDELHDLDESDELDETDEFEELDESVEVDGQKGQDKLGDGKEEWPSIKISRSTRVKQELIYKKWKD